MFYYFFDKIISIINLIIIAVKQDETSVFYGIFDFLYLITCFTKTFC